MEGLSQSLRRHHRARVIAKRSEHWTWSDKSPRQKGILAKTPTPCSCWMCGNPRRHSGKPTLQEAKHNLSAIEQSEDPEFPNIQNIGKTRLNW